MRSRLASALAVLAVVLAAAGASAATGPVDLARAVNVVPPGESGLITIPQFIEAQADGNFGPHFADQAPLYSSFRYKSDAFGKGTPWHTLTGATIYRDSWGVPQIYANSPVSLLRGMGYAMAADRLFQMEIFRRVGHGTLDLRPDVAAEEINAVNVRLPVHRADEDDDRASRPPAGCIGELLEVNAGRYDADALGCGHRGHRSRRL